MLQFVVSLAMVVLIVVTRDLPLWGGIVGASVSVAFIAGTVRGDLR